MLGVVLNLLAEHPNSQTLSLFVNGCRVGRPQRLPDRLKDGAELARSWGGFVEHLSTLTL